MSTTELTQLITAHRFFSDLSPDHIALLAGCARQEKFSAGTYIARMETPANTFYALLSGQIAIELPVAGRGAVIIQTLSAGTLFGWSWIFPPYRWQFDGRATEPSTVLTFNGSCLRIKCEKDPTLGYAFMKKFAQLMTKRLQATRLQLLDVYGKPQVPMGV